MLGVYSNVYRIFTRHVVYLERHTAAPPLFT